MGTGPGGAGDVAGDLFDLALRYWSLGRLEDALRVARQAEVILVDRREDPARIEDVAGAIHAIERQSSGREAADGAA
jgi:hypothetical protein